MADVAGVELVPVVRDPGIGTLDKVPQATAVELTPNNVPRMGMRIALRQWRAKSVSVMAQLMGRRQHDHKFWHIRMTQQAVDADISVGLTLRHPN